MDFLANSRRRSKKFKITDSSGGENSLLYRFSVQFYKVPPVDTISLVEFEQFALDRLTMLRIIENANYKHTKLSEAYNDYVTGQVRLKKEQLMAFTAKSVEDLTPTVYEWRRKDHISHFILRLAYCRSDELRKWFLKHEVDLFQFRFHTEGPATQGVLKHNGLNYQPIDDSEKQELDPNFRSAMCSILEKKSIEMEYYKVAFTEVLDLVGARKVFVKDGYAYVPQNDLASVVGNVYRTQLSQALAVMARLLPQMEEDDRLLSILKDLNDRYLGQDFGKTLKAGSGDVVPEMIDNLSKTSFPMCMRMVHESMREKHHLKHHGRLVYGLFLKAIGLQLEDAQRFFREEFLKSMDSETYEKKGYSYNIRYNYGAEGKKTNYTPYSCTAIITKHAPGPGDVHGCPFKHFDKNILQQRLQAMNISRQGIVEILDLSSKGHYQLACTKQFELTHGGDPLSQAINHPNYYYDESRKIYGDPNASNKKAVDRVKPSTQRSVVLPSQSSVNGEMDSMTQEDLEAFSQISPEDMELS